MSLTTSYPSPFAICRKVPNREHIHSVVCTPNGNDYGKDLLRQHYERPPASAQRLNVLALRGRRGP